MKGPTTQMASCRRCGGFVQADGEENTRCLQCGNYPLNVPYPEPARDAYARLPQCYNCKQPAERGKHYCARHLYYMAEYNANRKLAKARTR